MAKVNKSELAMEYVNKIVDNKIMMKETETKEDFLGVIKITREKTFSYNYTDSNGIVKNNNIQPKQIVELAETISNCIKYISENKLIESGVKFCISSGYRPEIRVMYKDLGNFELGKTNFTTLKTASNYTYSGAEQMDKIIRYINNNKTTADLINEKQNDIKKMGWNVCAITNSKTKPETQLGIMEKVEELLAKYSMIGE